MGDVAGHVSPASYRMLRFDQIRIGRATLKFLTSGNVEAQYHEEKDADLARKFRAWARGPSSASATDMARTSLMLRPPKWYSSTDAWNRFPSHSSHVVATPAIIPRST